MVSYKGQFGLTEVVLITSMSRERQCSQAIAAEGDAIQAPWNVWGEGKVS